MSNANSGSCIIISDKEKMRPHVRERVKRVLFSPLKCGWKCEYGCVCRPVLMRLLWVNIRSAPCRLLSLLNPQSYSTLPRSRYYPAPWMIARKRTKCWPTVDSLLASCVGFAADTVWGVESNPKSNSAKITGLRWRERLTEGLATSLTLGHDGWVFCMDVSVFPISFIPHLSLSSVCL